MTYQIGQLTFFKNPSEVVMKKFMQPSDEAGSGQMVDVMEDHHSIEASSDILHQLTDTSTCTMISMTRKSISRNITIRPSKKSSLTL